LNLKQVGDNTKQIFLPGEVMPKDVVKIPCSSVLKVLKKAYSNSISDKIIDLIISSKTTYNEAIEILEFTKMKLGNQTLTRPMKRCDTNDL